jgi:anthranilate synthase component 1
MAIPDMDKFREYSSRGNIIPVYREIIADMNTPVTALMRLGESPCFLLESVEGGGKWARYSFIGFGFSKIIRGFGKDLEITDKDGTRTIETDDPFDFLKEEMSLYEAVEVEGLPRFFGGLVGYIGYDMVRFIEELPDYERESLGMPDLYLVLTDTMLIFDNLRQKIKVVSSVHLNGDDPDKAYGDAVEKIDRITEALRKPPENTGTVSGGADRKEFVSAFGPKEDFMAAVSRAKEYVHAGDVVQVVLSQRFERETDVTPLNLYRALRVINPSPYMYYLDMGDSHIVGSSPEILVRLEGRDVTVRPIAGTRKRGETEEEDQAMEKELMEDPKEKAEHIMLVDLGRNDVGRVAKTGSVKVTDLMFIERYSHVMHIVSNVEGELAEGLDYFDVLRACFPAGTVSGAPKVRAMEIIEELEPLKRGAYAGAVGYFSYSGNMDTCITIRTLIIKDGKVYVQAGAGIVADSVPELEYKETVNKAAGMIKAVDMAEEFPD